MSASLDHGVTIYLVEDYFSRCVIECISEISIIQFKLVGLKADFLP